MDDFFQRLLRATPNAWVTPALIFLNVIVFLAMLARGADFVHPSTSLLLQMGGNHLSDTLARPSRLFTCMFLHAGIIHLVFNMWALWDMGRLAERFYGNLQFLILYLISGIAGAIASLYFGAQTTVSVGASGAIFGVTGALAAGVFTKHNKLPPALVSSMRGSLLSFIAVSMLMGFATPNIDNAAHIAGLACGFVLASVMAEKFDWDQYQRSRGPRLLAACLLATVVCWVAWKFVPLPVAG